MSAAATIRRTATRVSTRGRAAIRSCGRSSQASAGSTASSTTRSSGRPDTPLAGQELADTIAGFALFADLTTPQREQVVDVFSERSEEHTSELQSRRDLVCRLLLE